ncbi:MAG TPA: class I SAM-dependent methyltransferase [Rickettsiales bacterium]|nr:class I SAM-dependent methyltransferase [Rickettsiales bacterium]
MKDHSQIIHDQYDSQANAYLISAVHAAGPDLQYAITLVEKTIPKGRGNFLDMGCGGGHLSYALAPHAHHVTAADPSPQMVATVAAAAQEKGLGNIETVRASANDMTFATGSFCIAASRYSAHHWRDTEACIANMRRTIKPGGYLLMIDVVGHEDPLVDTHLQAMELLRDRSHIRNLTIPQWRQIITLSGFELLEEKTWPLPIAFAPWISRMKTSPEREKIILTLQAESPAEAKQALQFAPDGSFMLQTGLFWAKAV